MAKLVTKSKLIRKAAPAPPPKALTLEQIRERHHFGTLERAVGECGELVNLKDQARELVNATNRQKTQAGKALKAMVADDALKMGDEIQIGGLAFSYDYAMSEGLPPADLYELVKKGDVKLDDFLKCVYVNKDMATKVIGAHIIDGIAKPKVGNKADVRIRELDTPVAKVQLVKKPLPAPPKSKVNPITDAPAANVSNATARVRPRRKINVRR